MPICNIFQKNQSEATVVSVEDLRARCVLDLRKLEIQRTIDEVPFHVGSRFGHPESHTTEKSEILPSSAYNQPIE
jgi:hypothetical protein